MHRLCWGWHFSIRSLWISRRKLLTTTAWAICIYCDVYVVSSSYESSVSKSCTWLYIIWGIVFSQIFFTWFLRPNFVISSHLQRSLVNVLRPSEWSVSTGEAYHWHKPKWPTRDLHELGIQVWIWPNTDNKTNNTEDEQVWISNQPICWYLNLHILLQMKELFCIRELGII